MNNFLGISNDMWLVLVLIVAIIWCTRQQVETFEQKMYQQQTLRGSNFPVSVTTGGQNVAPLRIMTEEIPFAWFNVDPMGSDFATFEGTVSMNSPAVATGQPMSIANIPTSSLYTLHSNELSSTMTAPVVSKPSFSTTGARNLIGSNAIQIPVESNKSFNEVPNVDFPGNDLMCQMYTDGGSSDTCRESCYNDAKCAGYVNIAANTNAVFPGGFCCAKHTMVDTMSSPGVSSYLKMKMSPQ
jgi:hypothetical protein